MSGTSLQQLLGKIQPKQYKDKSILDFSNSKVNKIGQIPRQFSQQVQVLNLSNNNLRSIQGLDQFKKLQCLNLVNNKISKGQNLSVLKNLHHLKRISLSRNPFLENPLGQDILTLLSSYQNDLQILDYAFLDPDRQSLVNQHRRSRSQSRIKEFSQVKKITPQQEFQKLSKNIKVSKSIQKSKASILMSQMQQYIEEKHQSQQISSYQIDNILQRPNFPENSSVDISLTNPASIRVTPIKKSPKFGSFSMEQKPFGSLNQTNKLNQQSTNLKFKNMSNSKVIQQSFPFQSKNSSRFQSSQRISWQNYTKNQTKKSPQKNFKYQVNNLKINMDLDHAALNYPSITQKEDHDSYEIQFDFMSPRKRSPEKKKQASPEISPSRQLKELTASYVKIQQDEVLQRNKDSKKIQKQSLEASPITQRIEKPQTPKGTLQSLTKKLPSYNLRHQRKASSKVADKQNHYQKSIQAPISLGKRGSLYQSTRTVVPQANTSNALDIISKLINNRGLQEVQSSSINVSLGEMLQNSQKFEKFYYTSLTRLKPAFSLLYSPFSSLKAEQKDLLLQELFKNHKQIFILLLKEFYNKQKLQDELQQKQFELKDAQKWEFQSKALSQKINQMEKVLEYERLNYDQVENQNKKLKRYIDQFEDILASRQKIISEVKKQIEKANKTLIKKEQIIQKSLNEDQIEEKIIQISQKRIKNKFLKLVQKKAQWTIKFHKFIEKRQIKQKLIRQSKQRVLKKFVFQNFLANQKKQKSIRQFIHKNEVKKIEVFFHQWKTEANLIKIQNQIQKNRESQNKKNFLFALSQFYLNKKRNKKILDMNKIKLQKKVFFKGFKQNFAQQKQRQVESKNKSANFETKNLLLKYFSYLKNIVNDQIRVRSQNQEKITKQIITKRSFSMFRKISQYQKKQQQTKLLYIKQKVIRQNQINLFLGKLKVYANFHHKMRTNSKILINHRLQKVFQAIKRTIKKNLKKFNRFQKLARKIAHEKRLEILLVNFRQNTLRNKIQKNKKQSLYNSLKASKNINDELIRKKQEVLENLDFKRGIRAKNELISLLRHENMKKKMNNRRLVMEEHYLIQQSKYKQSHDLNMLTMDQLKNEIQTYLQEIEFYKIQVQKLSQRQLFILEQKQNCLLQIQSKQQENLSLRKAILQNEKQMEELQRKYEKSLDMYAAAYQQVKMRQALLEKNQYLNETYNLSNHGNATTFRRQVSEPYYGSLKR